MPRYFFNLIDGQPFEDTDGLELADCGEARDEAIGFARDIIRDEPNRRDWSSWCVRVTNEQGEHVLEVPFLETLQ